TGNFFPFFGLEQCSERSQSLPSVNQHLHRYEPPYHLHTLLGRCNTHCRAAVLQVD
ncbi:hypothetical protein NDU88_004669, partial [Pleurodeles waltl]